MLWVAMRDIRELENLRMDSYTLVFVEVREDGEEETEKQGEGGAGHGVNEVVRRLKDG